MEQKATKPKSEMKEKTTSAGTRTVFSISETRQMKLLRSSEFLNFISFGYKHLT